MTQLAFDSKRLGEAVRAGFAPQLIRQLERQKGISFHPQLGEQRFVEMLDKGAYPVALDTGMAMDVQSELVTTSNAGIPWFMLNWQDPKIIATLVTPMMAAVIAGERLVGNWAMETAMFRTAEAVGDTSAYGDYADGGGATNVNVNFPQRQNFLFQSFMQYGELELARWGEAQIDWASQQQVANVLALKKALNFLYFYGVSTLENYGLLNDPSLPPALTATYSWLSSASATANTMYQDVVRMFIQQQVQAQGTVRMDDRMVLAMSPQQAVALSYITQYNTNSVKALLEREFPQSAHRDGARVRPSLQHERAADAAHRRGSRGTADGGVLLLLEAAGAQYGDRAECVAAETVLRRLRDDLVPPAVLCADAGLGRECARHGIQGGSRARAPLSTGGKRRASAERRSPLSRPAPVVPSPAQPALR